MLLIFAAIGTLFALALPIYLVRGWSEARRRRKDPKHPKSGRLRRATDALVDAIFYAFEAFLDAVVR